MVADRAEREGIAPAQSGVGLAVAVEVRRLDEASAARRREQENFALADAQEDAAARAALVRVVGARADGNVPELPLAAVALAAEDLAADETHGRVPRVLLLAVRTHETRRRVHQLAVVVRERNQSVDRARLLREALGRQITRNSLVGHPRGRQRFVFARFEELLRRDRQSYVFTEVFVRVATGLRQTLRMLHVRQEIVEERAAPKKRDREPFDRRPHAVRVQLGHVRHVVIATFLHVKQGVQDEFRFRRGNRRRGLVGFHVLLVRLELRRQENSRDVRHEYQRQHV